MFLENLNLEMTMAHADGNLLHETKSESTSNGVFASKFLVLCMDNEAPNPEINVNGK